VVTHRPQVAWFIVHSLNEAAARVMVADLAAAGYRVEYRPGAWMSADVILAAGGIEA
jgi:hypothetical protein